ncbi:Lrp/AsnC family transcriptional regulator [Streptomyces sp. NPDC005373]|uniref:Lrp/AsnC family transcriptional regulator n=1 Tax=Streptomyces sp. NPDC005373 TaxID=3156879 RepID=UPI00339FEC7D
MSPSRTDLELLRLMVEAPRVGVREYARRLGIARGTAQARVSRLESDGVITDYRPQLSPTALGFPVMAYVHVHVSQGEVDDVFPQLALVPELLEASSIAGDADLVCRVIARDHVHLQSVLQRIIGTPGVQRTRSEVVLERRIEPRATALINSMLRDGP